MKVRSRLNKTLSLTPVERVSRVDQLPSVAAPPSGIYCNEVVSALTRLPDEHFQLIIADPPYNLRRNFGNDSDCRTEEEYEEWVRSWIPRLPRVMNPTGSLYICIDWKHSGLYQQIIEESGLTVLNRITWQRDKGRGATRNWKQNMEDIWFAVKDPKEYTFNLEDVKIRRKVHAPYRENGIAKDWMETANGERVRFTHPPNIWTDLTVPFWSMPENTDHPTQKPEALAERIIVASSNPGDRVLDLFSGSGTTSVVAKKLAREFVGLELNPDYVRMGHKRLRLSEALEID